MLCPVYIPFPHLLSYYWTFRSGNISLKTHGVSRLRVSHPWTGRPDSCCAWWPYKGPKATLTSIFSLACMKWSWYWRVVFTLELGHDLT